ncbi:hypothetical protein [Dactylosporangium darangshiense]
MHATHRYDSPHQPGCTTPPEPARTIDRPHTCTHRQGHQVGHILRAAADAARIAEIEAGGDPAIGMPLLERSGRRATPVLIDVLDCYPLTASGSNRVAQLMNTLDRSLRQTADW